jgi:hypothetical protein
VQQNCEALGLLPGCAAAGCLAPGAWGKPFFSLWTPFFVYSEVAARPPAAAPTSLHHIAYLQGHAVLIDLQAARPNLSKEERNSFLLKDLGINPADVTDVFMVLSTQLLCVGFHAEGP